MPGPAAASDIDHRVDHAAGGLTTPENLHPPCRHDHRVKHNGGWYLQPAADGATVWVSPLGRRHLNRPPPVMPASVPHLPRHHDDLDHDPAGHPWQPDCDCLLHPCTHDTAARKGSRDNTDSDTTDSDATAKSDGKPQPQPPILDDEPPF